MIPWHLIAAAALLTAGSVAVAGWISRGPQKAVIIATLLSGAFIVGWRAMSNMYGLNEDFGPLVSVGDMGCLVAGGLGPIVASAGRELPRRWLLVSVGALAGF